MAFFLLGGDESETERLAATTPAAPAADSTSPAPPAPPAAGDSGADSGRPVIQVMPRKAEPNATPDNTAAASDPAGAPQDEAPSFDVVRIEKTGETVIAGRAAPDSEVTVSTEDGTAIGTARADASGSWAIVADKPLAPGSHEIGIAAQGVEGEARLSDEVVVVVVPEPAAAAPRSALPQSALPETGQSPSQAAAADASAQPQQQVLAVLTPRDGGASKVLPQEEDGIAQGDLVLDSVDYDENGQAVIGGRAAPGSRMLLYLNNKLVGDTVAGPEGRWSHAPQEPVAEGLHALRVDQVDGGGSVTARVETPFSREAARVPVAGEEIVIVQPGNSLWRIARRTYGRGLQYSVIYQANREQIRDPDLIYPGQVFEIPKIN
ncbi:Ig-like domain-containing protein [Pelagibius sp. 7325]|uniref:Ig-like domain-containing protein n=1 Tax=Pelagibius sp. 7325 TaxID=3131994 RepID=UPI0030EF1E2C